MSFNFIDAPIGYGEANFKAVKNTDTDYYYSAERVKNRGLLDFGELEKDERVGIELKSNGINYPVLLKSLHAPASNKTDDTLLVEIHHKQGVGVSERFFLQYFDRNVMPVIFPEFILFPENVIYVIPNQTSQVLMVIEPVNLLVHALATTQLI